VKVDIQQRILAENERQAQENRTLLRGHGILAVNLIGGPGCGKTTLLEATIRACGPDAGTRRALSFAVIEGDVATEKDAQRIAELDVPVVQINTHGGCHLDARMVASAFEDLPLDQTDILFIENVGNLVCPAEFDLGEHAKVAMVSVTEGDDKPAKYPIIFRNARAAVISKSDLLPVTNFRLRVARRDVRAINRDLELIALSAATGRGMERWLRWLRRMRRERLGNDTSQCPSMTYGND